MNLRRLEEWRGTIGLISLALAAIGICLIAFAGMTAPWVVLPTAVLFALALLCFLGPWIFILIP
jgi:hypothetical protein